jgi:alpha-1,2-mannosyltransferase
VYLAGGDALLHGHDIYGPAVRVHGYGFTYPPFAALPMALLAALPGWLAETLTALAFFAALAVVVQVCAPGLIRRVADSWTAVALLAVLLAGQPTWATLHDGQINMLLAALVLYDLRPGAPRSSTRGALVGVAAGLKLTPAVFVLYLLVRRRFAEARNAALAFLTTAVVAALVSPSDSRAFWTHRLYDTGRVGDASRVSNQSLLGLLLRATSNHTVAHGLWLPLALLTLGLALRVAVQLSLAGCEVLALGVVGVAGCLVSPVSWTHHWVWFIPLLCGLVRSPYGARRWGAALIGTLALVFFVGVNKPPMRSTYGNPLGSAVLGNLFVLAALATIAALAVAGVSAARPAARPEPIRTSRPVGG